MYKKIKQDFLNPICDDWYKFKGSELVTSYESGTVFLEYHNTTSLFKNQHVRNPFKIQPTSVVFAEMKGKGMLLPHRDHGVKTGLNYYISADQDITSFYKTKNNEVLGFNYPGQSTSNIYNQDDVVEIDRFVANSNEAYLLDISQIHSVERISSNSRIFIGYQWADHAYEEVLDSLL